VNAVMSKEPRVIAEDRIARMESDVAEIKDDVKVVNVRLNESIVANAREFGAVRAEAEKRFSALRSLIESNKTETEKNLGSLRTETEKGFGALRSAIDANKTETEKNLGSLRTETEKGFGALRSVIDANKTETEKGFGSVRVEIEKVRTTIESTKLWLIINTLVIVGTILGAVTAYLHAVKII
jgi:hypothetical protein